MNNLMSELLINKKYLAMYSELPVNYDFEDILPMAYSAQQIWLLPVLGENVYDTLLAYVQSEEEIPEEYQTLLLKCYPYLAKAITLEALPFIAYRMSESGIVKHKTDTDESIDMKELNYLQTNIRAQLEVLKEQLVSWLLDFGGNYDWRPQDCSCECSCIKKLKKPNPLKHIYAPRRKDMTLS